MATEKNITMKEFNGTDYDILYPKTKTIQIDGFDDSIAKIVPVGSIYWYASTTIPDGFLLCDGSQIGRTDYASLFAVIGTVFGAGNGSTTFSLPDLRAKFIRGSGASGSFSATFGQTQSPSYFYTVTSDYCSYADIGSVDNYGSGSCTVWKGTAHWEFSPTNGYIRPYNIALTPIIKY